MCVGGGAGGVGGREEEGRGGVGGEFGGGKEWWLVGWSFPVEDGGEGLLLRGIGDWVTNNIRPASFCRTHSYDPACGLLKAL